MKMEIKKISKIDFDVEAQCNHGSSSSKGGCHADCKNTKYYNSSALVNLNALLFPKYRYKMCSTSSYYTCATLCIW